MGACGVSAQSKITAIQQRTASRYGTSLSTTAAQHALNPTCRIRASLRNYVYAFRLFALQSPSAGRLASALGELAKSHSLSHNEITATFLPRHTMRDDFDKSTKDVLARRVNFHCSMCWSLTSGPQVEPTRTFSIGVAAHISAASSGGPRYDPDLLSHERKSIRNAIWLCQNCAKFVDSDLQRYTVRKLQEIKSAAEQRVHEEITRAHDQPTARHPVIAYRFMPNVDLTTRDAQYNIMYVARVVGQIRSEIEDWLGSLDEINIVNVGSLDSIPQGGEVRWYRYEGYLLSVDYDLGDRAQGVRFEDFAKHNYTFVDYFEIFHRLGISIGTNPDIFSPIKIAWSNYQGYYLSIALDRVDGIVNIVRAHRIPQQ
jgi:hypothetical protein